MKTITLTLPTPTSFGSAGGTLSTLTLKESNAGSLVLARAAITRDKRFGKEMMDDPMTMLLFSLPQMVVNTDALALPPLWPMALSEENFSYIAEATQALREGLPSVEALREAQAKEKAKQEAAGKAAEEAGVPFPVAESAEAD